MSSSSPSPEAELAKILLVSLGRRSERIRAEVRDFQARHFLPVTGEIDGGTRQALEGVLIAAEWPAQKHEPAEGRLRDFPWRGSLLALLDPQGLFEPHAERFDRVAVPPAALPRLKGLGCAPGLVFDDAGGRLDDEIDRLLLFAEDAAFVLLLNDRKHWVARGPEAAERLTRLGAALSNANVPHGILARAFRIRMLKPEWKPAMATACSTQDVILPIVPGGFEPESGGTTALFDWERFGEATGKVAPVVGIGGLCKNRLGRYREWAAMAASPFHGLVLLRHVNAEIVDASLEPQGPFDRVTGQGEPWRTLRALPPKMVDGVLVEDTPIIEAPAPPAVSRRGGRGPQREAVQRERVRLHMLRKGRVARYLDGS